MIVLLNILHGIIAALLASLLNLKDSLYVHIVKYLIVHFDVLYFLRLNPLTTHT